MLKRFKDWLSERPAIQRLCRHSKEFKYIWILLFLITGICIIAGNNMLHWSSTSLGIKSILCLIAVLFFIRPMNAVYGLMGTSGSIRLFFITFFVITILFACIYQAAFFKDAGISYDVNQPHIDYQLFADINKENSEKVSKKVYTKTDTIFLEHQLDSITFNEKVIHTTTDTLHYQKIDLMQVWRSTILTTLIQEPADLLSTATIHNEAMESTNVGLDKEKSELFEWILIFHIIISWIFFGVFISLLYNKFRYES